MFRVHVLIIGRSKLHYTASGIITATGGRLVHETATCSNFSTCVPNYKTSHPEDRNVDSHRQHRDPQTSHLNNVFLLSTLTSF